jgi:hypothetical protein
MLNVFILKFFVLSVVMLSAFMLNVVMLIVMIRVNTPLTSERFESDGAEVKYLRSQTRFQCYNTFFLRHLLSG